MFCFLSVLLLSEKTLVTEGAIYTECVFPFHCDTFPLLFLLSKHGRWTCMTIELTSRVFCSILHMSAAFSRRQVIIISNFTHSNTHQCSFQNSGHRRLGKCCKLLFTVVSCNGNLALCVFFKPFLSAMPNFLDANTQQLCVQHLV